MANDGNWGGRRAGAGRKPGKRTSKWVPHRKRPIAGENPARASMTFRKDIDMAIAREIVRREVARMDEEYDAPRKPRTLPAAPLSRVRLRGRTLTFEVRGTVFTLSESVQKFGTRVARAINKAMSRRGKVFADRYRLLSKPYVPPPQPTFGERMKTR